MRSLSKWKYEKPHEIIRLSLCKSLSMWCFSCLLLYINIPRYVCRKCVCTQKLSICAVMAEKQNQQSSALVACMHAKGSLSNYFQDYIHTHT